MKKLHRFIKFITQSSRYKLISSIYLSYILFTKYVLVTLIPLRLYYKKYIFSDADTDIDLQPFQQDLSLLNKLRNVFPRKITCFVYALAIQTYLKKNGIIAPIKLGLNTHGNMSAHAWIWQNRSLNEYKKIKW